MDLYELLDLYRLHRPQLSDSTAETYRYAIRSLERFLGRVPRVPDLSEGITLRFLGRRLGEAAGWTCKREVGSLSLLWRFAWKRKLTDLDPRDADIPPVRLRQEPPIALTVQQVEAILDSCRFERSNIRGTEILKSAWWRALVLVLYWSGARIGAIIDANRDDLDERTGWLHLRAESAKTGAGQWCQLPLDVVRSIPGADFLFPWPYGRRQLFAALKRIVVRAGLPASREYRFHAFRRTAATLATAESSLDVARRALGHTRESMTLRYIDPRVSSQPLLTVLPKVVG
jgi:integrase